MNGPCPSYILPTNVYIYSCILTYIKIFFQDNIPGVSGLGPVAAAALVNHFKCVDAMCTTLRLPG